MVEVKVELGSLMMKRLLAASDCILIVSSLPPVVLSVMTRLFEASRVTEVVLPTISWLICVAQTSFAKGISWMVQKTFGLDGAGGVALSSPRRLEGPPNVR